MSDLEFKKTTTRVLLCKMFTNDSLDRDTALGYRSRIELKKELGQYAVGDLESLSTKVASSPAI